jgi:hypothetical protein
VAAPGEGEVPEGAVAGGLDDDVAAAGDGDVEVEAVAAAASTASASVLVSSRRLRRAWSKARAWVARSAALPVESANETTRRSLAAMA